MKDVRELFEGQRILEKTEGSETFKRIVYGALLISSPEAEDDSLVLDMGSYGYEYSVDGEDVTISPDGTIEFEAFDAEYVIRAIGEDDDLSNLNPETETEEEEEG